MDSCFCRNDRETRKRKKTGLFRDCYPKQALVTPPSFRVLSNHMSKAAQRLKETFERHLPCDPDRIFCYSKLVIFLGIIHKKINYPNVIGIGQHGIFISALHLCQSLVRFLEDVLPITKIHRSCWAGLNTGWKHPLFGTIEAHRAFSHDSHTGIESRNIIRTCLTNLLEICRFHLYFWTKDDCPCFLILNNGTLCLPIRYLFTRRGDAMPALIWEEVPGYLIPRNLAKSNQFPCIVGKIRGILMISPVNRFFCSSLIPLLTGHLTASASGTLCCIDEE
jgi:hypothetical protein